MRSISNPVTPALRCALLVVALATTVTAEIRVDTLATLDIGTGGLSVDADGNVYSSDFGTRLGRDAKGGTKVLRITPGGEVSLFADGLDGASGSEIGSDGYLYQSNIRGRYVSRIAMSGEHAEFASDGFESPVGIVQAPGGAFYVANCGSGSIQRVAPDGSTRRFLESDLLKCPNGITLDPEGNLYVANFYDGKVIKIDPEGRAEVLAEVPGNNNGHLIYHRGKLYVAARSAHQIYTVSLDGAVALLAGSGEKGGADGTAAEASFCYPNDLALSPDGRLLYVNEVGDETSDGEDLVPTRVRVISLD